ALGLEVYAVASGQPRQTATLADLLPGNRGVRKFLYTGGAASLKGRQVVIGVQDRDGGGRLVRDALIE
ncbi:MAG: hypothetical protein KDA28_12885, partial [Phycisphaerales bacterium]|nr:hypothetical protein [Phycisphaerales bacterium]